MTGSALRTHLTGCCLLAIGVVTYVYSLDGLYIPHIGDEAPYIQIVRRTAESERWLPLRTPPGLENTKPPLLFWLGIVSTDWARQWTLMRLRFPIIWFTFATAALVFFLARRTSSDGGAGYLGALSFLAFASTFQYGRPFLTNMPETLFVFLFFFSFIFFRERIPDRGILFWLGIGLSLGLACLFKSFVLVVPVGVALSGCLLAERSWDLRTFVRHDIGKVTTALLTALVCFSLWPLLDPDPASVIRQFVIEENLGKLATAGYLHGLVSAPYPLYRIWLGPVANAGLLALPLLYLAVRHWQRRRELTRWEQSLWILVLSFLLVYSIPAQRQENYLLPIMPALAVLLSGEWKKMGRLLLFAFALPNGLALLILIGLMDAVSGLVPGGSYVVWQRALPWVTLVVLAGGLLQRRYSSYAFHLGALLALASLAAALAPFEGPAGRYDRQTQAALAGKVVHVPSNFIAKYERHRFLLPQSEIEGYDPLDRQRVNHLLQSGQIVAIERPMGQTVAGPFEVYGRRLTLRSRQRRDEIVRILIDHDLDPLVQQELIVQRRSP